MRKISTESLDDSSMASSAIISGLVGLEVWLLIARAMVLTIGGDACGETPLEQEQASSCPHKAGVDQT